MLQRAKSRRPLALVSPLGIIHLQRRNPYLIAWWSAAFPGFGHFMMNKYFTGVFLSLSEVITNSLSHINLAMVYSFCGNFEMAKQTVQSKWVFGYMIIYFFAIWDSFRCCHHSNKLYQLATAENARLAPFSIRPTGIQYMELRRPLTAALCSVFFPGLGQLYIHRIGLAFYGIFWWWVYVALSRAYEGLLALLLGHPGVATELLRPHWLLFMPSVMGGAVYHAYVTAIEHNRLFCIEQRQFLKERYVPARPDDERERRNVPMWVVGTFEHSIELEQALASLEQHGIEPIRITPVLMEAQAGCARKAPGEPAERMVQAVEIGIACATAASVIGISVGFILAWGPIIWGLAAGAAGFTVGLCASLLLSASSGKPGRGTDRLPDVTLLIECRDTEEALVKQVLWTYKALTVGRMEHPFSTTIP